MHSYVDLNDPTFLEFDYVKSFSDAVAVAWPDHRALDALHVGGGGFTMPRYLAAEYPGTKSTVLEIDPSVLKTGRERLGLHTSNALQRPDRRRPHRHPRRARRLGRPRRRRRVRQPVGAVAPHHPRVRRATSIACSDPDGVYIAERDRLPAVPVRARRARDVADAVRLGRGDRPAVDLRRPLRRQHRARRIRPPLDGAALARLARVHGDVVLEGARARPLRRATRR